MTRRLTWIAGLVMCLKTSPLHRFFFHFILQESDGQTLLILGLYACFRIKAETFGIEDVCRSMLFICLPSNTPPESVWMWSGLSNIFRKLGFFHHVSCVSCASVTWDFIQHRHLEYSVISVPSLTMGWGVWEVVLPMFKPFNFSWFVSHYCEQWA